MSDPSDGATVHAGAARVDGVGILVRGASGSGKSSLLLALLMADRAAGRLIADDRVQLLAEDGKLLASVPEAIAGLLEIRGQGIVRWPSVSPAEIGLVVDLEAAERCPRMPSAEARRAVVAGVELPRLMLPIGSPDGWIRVRAAIAVGASILE